jgi:hypothetical protein|tara:strand:+ start:2533 stop:2751 length:219 start_codon:yes stop_codon:yes gene_type:complete
MTPDEIRAKIASLQGAMFSGVLNVKHGETSTTFRSQAEIQSALRALESSLVSAEGGSRRRRGAYITQSGKGL